MPATPAWPPKSAPRLFVPRPLAHGAPVEIDRAQAHYLLKVMRVTEGDAVVLCDDITGEWAARVDVPLGGRRSVDICLPLPAAGQYSVAVRHDSNANKKSDWNDGAGFSRNPRLSLLGRPSFAATAVAVQRGPTRLNVVINYRKGMSVGPIG